MVGSGWIRLKIGEQTICTTAAELFSPNLESFHNESTDVTCRCCEKTKSQWLQVAPGTSYFLSQSRYVSLTSTGQCPRSLLIERVSLPISSVLGFCAQNVKRNVAFYKRTNTSLLYWYPLKTCRGWYVGIISFSTFNLRLPSRG